MKNSFLIVVIITIALSCKSQKIMPSHCNCVKGAIKLVTLAQKISIQNYCNKDSILKQIEMDEQAIRIDSTCDIAYADAAEGYTDLKDYQKAINQLNKYDRLSNCNITLTVFKGYLYEKIGKQDSANIAFKSAMIRYNNKIQDDPKNILWKVNRMFLLFFTDGDSSAKAEYEKIAIQYPGDKYIKEMKEEVDSFNRIEMVNSITKSCNE